MDIIHAKITIIRPDLFIKVNGIGYFLTPEDFPQLAEHVKAVQYDTGKTHVLSENGTGNFTENFDIEPFYAAWCARHDQVLDQQQEAARAEEEYLASWDYVRDERNRRIAACDWTQLSDSPLKDNPAWLRYRQALRDITESAASPQAVVWPEPPQ